MLEEPPVLQIKRPTRRPTNAQIKAFQGVPTGFVADSMQGRGSLSPAIRPVGEGRDIACIAAGPALTASNGAGDIMGTLAALQFIQPGDILTITCGPYQGCASAGDRVCGMLKNCGAHGLVTDSPVRDYAGIVEVGLPVWCTGLNPNSPFTTGPASVGRPIALGGAEVETGDMIVADRDGVVVVPFEHIDQVIATLALVSKAEMELDAEVANGLKVPDAVKELIASEKTRFVDE